MKDMELTRRKIQHLIMEIEVKTKQITRNMIEKYVRRNMDDSSNEKDMIADMQKIVNQRFNIVEMYEKRDAILILRGHIEYLDDIINKTSIIRKLSYFLIVLLPIVYFVCQSDSLKEEERETITTRIETVRNSS